MQSQSQPPKLLDVLPELVRELQALLRNHGESELAIQVQELRIVDRCRCGDDFCGTFYAQPRPKDAWGASHRNVSLSPEKGMLILDVVDGKIACVEALYRDDIRQAVHRAVP